MGSEKVRLKKITTTDLELILAWRSHPNIYRFFRIQQQPLTWGEHYHFWLNRRHRVDFLILYQEDQGGWRKVGTLNISKLDSGTPEIGILIGEITLQGKGIGSLALKKCLFWLKKNGYKTVAAEINRNNKASQSVFRKNGFILANNQKSPWQKYLKKLS